MDESKMTLMQRTIFEDCYNYLVRQNEESIHSVAQVGGEFMYGRYAEFVFSICEDLSLNYECRFLALELFNRFMYLHLVQVNKNFDSQLQERLLLQPSNVCDEVRTTLSSDFFTLIEKQVPLRILSCIQLASKIVQSSSAITPVQAKAVLLKKKYNYSLRAVCESEIRVWKTLGFSAMAPTPFGFIELICEFLGNIYSTDMADSVDAFHGRLLETSCQLLQYFYIVRPFFYLELYRQVTKNESVQQEDERFIARVSADHLLLAAGIVSLSTYLIWGERYFVEIVRQLCALTFFSEEDISDVTRVFGKIIALPETDTVWQNIFSASALING